MYIFYKIYLQWIYWTLFFMARCSTISRQWSPRELGRQTIAMHSSTPAGITNLLSLVALNPVQLQQDQAPPIIPQPAAAAMDVHFAAGAGIQVAAGVGHVPGQRRIQNQVRRLGASSNEPVNQVSVRRSGTRQIRRPRRFLDFVVPYFCSRKSH
jgi:hypothetical protein